MSDLTRSGDFAQALIEPSAQNALEDWPNPQSLPDELPAVQPFEFDLLPSSLRGWIEDIAERVQCPPDYPAVAVMIALAIVVGRKVGIRPKRHDDWLVIANLWGMVIGPPGVMKTPALQEPLKPLKRLEIEAKQAYEKDLVEYRAQVLVAEQRMSAAKVEIKKAFGDGRDPMRLARDALVQDKPAPVRRRYLVNNTTVEKLGEILNQNPNGVGCYRDEVIGLLKSLEKEGQEDARAFYLEAWDGKGRYTYDRIGRGTIDIEAAIVSLIGSIQPGPLRAYLRGAVNESMDADGLIQRFQLAVYPDISKKWRNVDRWPDTPARNAAHELICKLDQLNPALAGAATDDFDPDGIPFLRFAEDAQSQFDEWRYDLEHRLRSGEDHSVMVEHLSKFRSLIPSLALLIHLADGAVGPVTAEALRKAIAWGTYLESHARRIYSTAIKPDTSEAIALAKKIISGELPDNFAIRDIYRNGWIGLGTREAAARAVDVLEDLDWLIKSVEETSTKPRTRYLINPKLTRARPKSTDKTDKSGSVTDLSVLSVGEEGESTEMQGGDRGR